MKIGLVGPTSKQRSLPFDAQRTINLYAVLDEDGKEPAALYGTPGKSLFASTGVGPVRGCYAAANGRAFVVSGSSLYEINNIGTATLRGALEQSAGTVTIAENGFQLAICDGSNLYIFTYADNTFQKVTDSDLPIAGTVCFLDGYFIINEVNSGRLYISALYDGLSWDALDFATAESSPDNLIRVFNALGQLWLLGIDTGEIWTNVGGTGFPFQRISGAKLEVGILAYDTAVALDNSIFWVGRDKDGSGIVYKAQGFTPKRISTEAIELALQVATDKTNIRGYTYQQDGHTFYMLTGGGLETSLVYDVSTDIWHERAYLNEEGVFEQDLAVCCMFAFGVHLVGDRLSGNIYQMSLDVFADYDRPLVAERVFVHVSDEDKRIRYNRLSIEAQMGVGLQDGQGSDPQISLFISKDGGQTYSDEFFATLGRAGQTKAKAVFRRLGIAEEMTFKVRITDPVKRILIGGYLS